MIPLITITIFKMSFIFISSKNFNIQLIQGTQCLSWKNWTSCLGWDGNFNGHFGHSMGQSELTEQSYCD